MNREKNMIRFDVTLLGCGSATPTLRHEATAQVVNLHDKLYMIDCGEGAQLQMRRMHIRFNRLTHIFISHLHGDHCFGLPGLLSTLGMLGRKGELVTKRDDGGRRTIYDSLPEGFSRFVSVGRLDFASEGLLLLTDAPAIATALMNSDIEREYYLKVKGEVKEEVVTAIREGFFAADASKGAHAKSKIKSMEFKPFLGYRIMPSSGGYTKIKAIINEGQNRELRRFFGYFDLDVVELKRTAFGRMTLGTLKPGKWRYFDQREYEDLRDFLKENKIRY